MQENLCEGKCGGQLDFPRFIAFTAMKLVIWWEEEFIRAFHRPSGFMQYKNEIIINISAEKSLDPGKFASTIGKAADQLLGIENVQYNESDK